MVKKKKEPKVEKVFKGKNDDKNEIKTEESSELTENIGSNIDDFLGKEEAPPEENKLTEKQKNKLEKINNVKSKISKILQSTNIEIIDENFDDDYESSDTPGSISQEDYDSLKSMYGGKDKNKKVETTLTIDDFDYMYVGQYLEEYDLMHMKNIKKVKIQKKRSPKLKKFLIISAMVLVVAIGSVIAFFLTRETPVYLKSVSLNQNARSYYINQEFEYTGLYFLAEYSNGDIKRVKLDNSYFNGDLSTGKIERVGDQNENILFVNSGVANLVFSYQGFNVNYEVTVKRKIDSGLSVKYLEKIFSIPSDRIITKDVLRVFVHYTDIGKEYIEYSSTTGVSLWINNQKCTQTNDGYKIPDGINTPLTIVVKYLDYELTLDESKNSIELLK